MRIIVLYSGNYGERVLNNILTKFAPNIISVYEFEENLPEYIEDIENYVPDNLPECDLLVVTGLHGDINLVTCKIANKTGAKSVIIESHSQKQLPFGIRSEITESLLNVKCVFPKPFCSLKPVGDIYIDEFVKYFGAPKIEIIGEKFIKSVIVHRNAPCGSTKYIAENLTGYPLNEAEIESGNKLHNYPCLASMEFDNEFSDTILHLAGYKIKEAVKKSLGFSNMVLNVNSNCKGVECGFKCYNICPVVKMGEKAVEIIDKTAKINYLYCGLCMKCIRECPFNAIISLKYS
ncbi:Protein of unknown function DUF166 [Methanococcus vannielii SB]|uniref:4Fe-4S ferredoxin-type domain-containing protein n=1 Tax=Methanococcus vannielii (strain ATCC 35089 / DSM 1224 / JCM 13029 / OCM 148 / SB) TaxID=406327 RepID=A6UNZ9_METVS|nr:DUF166 domain-containing protein [Methanococcus vannielii]ABR54221.1 Protein of unknown function DUF166 [Methanococcus vannielii SB]